MSQTDPRAVANLLVGSHYECEDPWYSCPLSVEGCFDEMKPKECDCGHDKLVEAIARALADAERRGYRDALNDVTQDFAENLYDIGRDIGTNEVLAFLESRIVHYPKAQAQADKEG